MRDHRRANIKGSLFSNHKSLYSISDQHSLLEEEEIVKVKLAPSSVLKIWYQNDFLQSPMV